MKLHAPTLFACSYALLVLHSYALLNTSVMHPAATQHVPSTGLRPKLSVSFLCCRISRLKLLEYQYYSTLDKMAVLEPLTLQHLTVSTSASFPYHPALVSFSYQHVLVSFPYHLHLSHSHTTCTCLILIPLVCCHKHSSYCDPSPLPLLPHPSLITHHPSQRRLSPGSRNSCLWSRLSKET